MTYTCNGAAILTATLTADKKDEVWNALIEEWLNDGSVELVTEVYRQLGK